MMPSLQYSSSYTTNTLRQTVHNTCHSTHDPRGFTPSKQKQKGQEKRLFAKLFLSKQYVPADCLPLFSLLTAQWQPTTDAQAFLMSNER